MTETTSTGLRVLIAGGRALDDSAVRAELGILHAGCGEVAEVIADDTHAGDAAMRWAEDVGVRCRRARAEDLRDARIVALAFPDGVVVQLRRAGIEVREVMVA